MPKTSNIVVNASLIDSSINIETTVICKEINTKTYEKTTVELIKNKNNKYQSTYYIESWENNIHFPPQEINQEMTLSELQSTLQEVYNAS